jgi:arginine decarboxylase
MDKYLVSNLLPEIKGQQKAEQKGLLIGNRVPKDYFITQGTGESDITIHAGSYHLALQAAGIERANIMTYSSILPQIANLIEKPEDYTHGEVMESIMAVAHGKKGERISAGIIYGWLYDKVTGDKFGGLVCEHNGSFTEEKLEYMLHASLNELYINGFDKQYDLKNITLLKETFVSQKEYGTALVALCFTNYYYPIIN